ncbi:RQC-minor-1 family DNA-binding protein [Paenibacillus sp. 1P07SE]|uniref:RQC-minor-1 family DNA-binding protein n=1 Tax=Paenibacillus sp. 1P07SE TaxID=3132209 RepID=UPI0039A5C310
MPKKRRERVESSLPHAEKLAILRAADEIIAQGGRTLLTKILKGSKEKKLLELELNLTPAYGYFNHLTMDQILEKVDDMIDAGYLETELSGKLPMIVFSPLGWVIERDQRATEFVRQFDALLDSNVLPIDLNDLKDRNRGMIYLLLYKILNSRNAKYIPLLKIWERTEYKKVQAMIRQVIQDLTNSSKLSDAQWQELVRERARSLIVPSKLRSGCFANHAKVPSSCATPTRRIMPAAVWSCRKHVRIMRDVRSTLAAALPRYREPVTPVLPG